VIALLVVLVGFALILGKNDLAEKGLKVLVGLVLVLSFLPGLLARFDTKGARWRPTTPDLSAPWLRQALLVVLLAGVGLFAWRARALFARRRDERRQRSSSPRERALPPAPPENGDEEELP
jgi:hypothetical protein